MERNKRVVAGVAGGLLALTIAGSGVRAWAGKSAGGEEKEVKVTLSKAQLDASIKTALKAKPGKVLETEAEIENGKTLCEVKILAADGKTYEVEVDVAANKVLEVELDDDGNEESDEADDD